jgi:hypothetical protein
LLCTHFNLFSFSPQTKPFILVLDEIDELRKYGYEGDLEIPEGSKFARILYDVWTEMCLLVEGGNQLVFCGRSPTLFSLGRGLYSEIMQEGEICPPSGHKCYWILLDALGRCHVENQLRGLVSDTTEITAVLLDEVEHQSAGIARFVHFTGML